MAEQVTVRVTPDQMAPLRQFALDTSARVGRRLSLGAAIELAVSVATGHPDEVDLKAAASISRAGQGVRGSR